MIDLTNRDGILIFMGDFNAKIAVRENGEDVGIYGLGYRYERKRSQEREQIISNTIFKLLKGRLYTSKIPAK